MARVSEQIPFLLRELLEGTGLSPYMFAKRYGIPESTFYKALSGQNTPRVDVLETMCDGFGVSLETFFSRVKNTEQTIHYTNRERDMIELHRKLEAKDQLKVMAYMQGLFDGQNKSI